MATRITFFLVCFCSLALSQGVESQRKYKPGDLELFTEFIRSSGSVGVFKTHYHSDYVATDLYFDTPEQDVFNSGLSLRFRKRIISRDSAVYSFQLKTEMLTSDGVRTEVDEPELYFYEVVLPGYTNTLVHLLDSVFYYCGHQEQADRETGTRYIKLLSSWMEQKAEAPLAPFQKLKFLFPDLFTPVKIGSLFPVCMGESRRLRSHIYIDPANYNNQYGRLFKNPEAVKEKLDFFQTCETCIWVIESSLDSALFRSLLHDKASPHVIVEYEAECKYQFGETAVIMLNEFEQELEKEFHLQKTMDSKFRQSMLSFEN
jgi:hypothetical protein